MKTFITGFFAVSAVCNEIFLQKKPVSDHPCLQDSLFELHFVARMPTPQEFEAKEPGEFNARSFQILGDRQP